MTKFIEGVIRPGQFFEIYHNGQEAKTSALRLNSVTAARSIILFLTFYDILLI